MSTDVDIDMNVELMAHGYSNGLVGVFGGVCVCVLVLLVSSSGMLVKKSLNLFLFVRSSELYGLYTIDDIQQIWRIWEIVFACSGYLDKCVVFYRPTHCQLHAEMYGWYSSIALWY